MRASVRRTIIGCAPGPRRLNPGIIQVRSQVSGSTSARALGWQNIGVLSFGRCAMQKLDSSLALGRATYERWLGTEPAAIAAAAEALRRFEPEHPCLLELEVRLRRALQIKGILAEALHPGSLGNEG
jgi:hypothetical protein